MRSSEEGGEDLAGGEKEQNLHGKFEGNTICTNSVLHLFFYRLLYVNPGERLVLHQFGCRTRTFPAAIYILLFSFVLIGFNPAKRDTPRDSWLIRPYHHVCLWPRSPS